MSEMEASDYPKTYTIVMILGIDRTTVVKGWKGEMKSWETSSRGIHDHRRTQLNATSIFLLIIYRMPVGKGVSRCAMPSYVNIHASSTHERSMAQVLH